MSGSSVPEAARAAGYDDERERRWAAAVTSIGSDTRGTYRRSDLDKRGACMALADLEVAAATSAAVAEERATTGRRIEAALGGAWSPGDLARIEWRYGNDGPFRTDIAERCDPPIGWQVPDGWKFHYVSDKDCRSVERLLPVSALRAALASPGEET